MTKHTLPSTSLINTHQAGVYMIPRTLNVQLVPALGLVGGQIVIALLPLHSRRRVQPCNPSLEAFDTCLSASSISLGEAWMTT